MIAIYTYIYKDRYHDSLDPRYLEFEHSFKLPTRCHLEVNFKLRLVRSTGAVGTTTSIPARSIQTYVLPQQLTTAVQKSQKSAEIPREGERNR